MNTENNIVLNSEVDTENVSMENLMKTLFSIDLTTEEGISQLGNFRLWIEGLSEKGKITDELCLHLCYTADILITRAMYSPVYGKKPIKELKDVVADIIVKYFTTEYSNIPSYQICGRVYDLPLDINLIESHVDDNGFHCVKVYLQKPGLFIGRGGKNIDTINKIVREKTGLKDFHILIVETFGPTNYDKYRW